MRVAQVQIRAAQVEEVRAVQARHRHERQAALVEEDQRRDRERQRHERRAALAEEDQHREREAEGRRRQERRQRHEMIREQLEVRVAHSFMILIHLHLNLILSSVVKVWDRNIMFWYICVI